MTKGCSQCSIWSFEGEALTSINERIGALLSCKIQYGQSCYLASLRVAGIIFRASVGPMNEGAVGDLVEEVNANSIEWNSWQQSKYVYDAD